MILRLNFIPSGPRHMPLVVRLGFCVVLVGEMLPEYPESDRSMWQAVVGDKGWQRHYGVRVLWCGSRLLRPFRYLAWRVEDANASWNARYNSGEPTLAWKLMKSNLWGWWGRHLRTSMGPWRTPLP